LTKTFSKLNASKFTIYTNQIWDLQYIEGVGKTKYCELKKGIDAKMIIKATNYTINAI